MKASYVLLVVFLFASLVNAEERESVWTKLYDKNGFNVSFVFYSEADSKNNGVVVKLINESSERIHYKFKLIMRAVDKDAETNLNGWLDPGAILTGSDNGLLFIPFKDGTSIKAVGIKGVRLSFDDWFSEAGNI